MTALKRLSFFVPLTAWLCVQSCVTDNPAAYRGILGETRQPPSETSEATSTGGTQGGTVGSATTSGTTGTAGQAGASAGGAAGADTSGANSSTDGGEPSACVKPVDERYAPRCCESLTEYDEEIKKGTQCSANDVQLCYRECGPASIGWKEERCVATVYTEENCVFPPEVDYSCYKIPEEIDTASCGIVDAPPRATDECDAPECTLCNLDGIYVDTGDAAKDGWCVCRPPDENGLRTWTCASTTAWPCPLNKGC